jgi:predicted ATPase/DNA-binding winged helix-turn-helix (wHTH) protein
VVTAAQRCVSALTAPAMGMQRPGLDLAHRLPWMQFTRVPPGPAQTRTLPSATRKESVAFGRFVLLVQARELLAEGQPVHLGTRAADLLVALATRPGRLVSRQQLLDDVWAGLIVEENNLSVQINALRNVIGRDVIATVPGRGYRFVAPAVPLAAQSADASAASTAVPAAALPGALPEAQELIGRDVELAALSALIAKRRVVSLLGAGGIGKTRLAQALAHRHRGGFRHGVCFVELGAVDATTLQVDAQVDTLAHLITSALGLPQSGSVPPLEALGSQLEPLQLLLMLDNAEHLVEPLAAVVQSLLARAPGVKLIVTSQAPLRVAGEWRYSLQGLSLPQQPVDVAAALAHGAVALFVARAAALDSRFQLTDLTLPGVLDICRRLDGSALAIELAAARLPLLGLSALLQSLARPLQALTAGRRDAPLRQQTLRAALEWSHALLDAAEQAVFRRLAVFSGSTSLVLVQAVLANVGGGDLGSMRVTLEATSAGDSVLDALSNLIDRSLVQVVEDDAAPPESAPPRYRLLDAPRALAAEQLIASGEAPALERRLAWAMLALMERAYDHLLQGQRGVDAVIDDFAPDIDNGHAALRWALAHDPALALRIAPLLSLLMGRHRYAEQLPLWRDVEPLLDGPALLPPAALARAMLHCAKHWQNTRTGHARSRAEAARRLALAAGDRKTAYLALQVLGPTAWRAGDEAGLVAAVEASRAEVDPAWPPYLRQVQARNESMLCRWRDDHEGSIHWWRQQAALHRAAGASDVLSRINIASGQLAAGRYAAAAATARELAESLAGGREQKYRCFALSNLSGALLMMERTAEARDVLHESWLLARQFDMLPQWADDASLIAALEGRPRDALSLAGYADAAFAALGQPREAIDQARIDRACMLAQRALEAEAPPAAADAAGWKAEGAHLPLVELQALAFGRAGLSV